MRTFSTPGAASRVTNGKSRMTSTKTNGQNISGQEGASWPASLTTTQKSVKLTRGLNDPWPTQGSMTSMTHW